MSEVKFEKASGDARILVFTVNVEKLKAAGEAKVVTPLGYGVHPLLLPRVEADMLVLPLLSGWSNLPIPPTAKEQLVTVRVVPSSVRPGRLEWDTKAATLEGAFDVVNVITGQLIVLNETMGVAQRIADARNGLIHPDGLSEFDEWANAQAEPRVVAERDANYLAWLESVKEAMRIGWATIAMDFNLRRGYMMRITPIEEGAKT